ncbi:uncharacterized protein BP01DRAFT_174087 [Aspergillus saccharolyticus JOP 1030-1]|uniref:Uncharacterized protein n=1 Tax=Aspergillus saccharolyticus JOP 1030-1 TaxID=1450539 RepID=A0A318ZKE0_9EURO|nr:hypothetical protein BP01DRAFT_174087 [Aspergillus saccharolyticus JOP 1030-1]PYH47976.1 hypothetical protein BP01DRAFT_174087 [Aspergillus saccharolyticus JOP 1030-1]
MTWRLGFLAFAMEAWIAPHCPPDNPLAISRVSPPFICLITPTLSSWSPTRQLLKAIETLYLD